MVSATMHRREALVLDRFARQATPCPVPDLNGAAVALDHEFHGWHRIQAAPAVDRPGWTLCCC